MFCMTLKSNVDSFVKGCGARICQTQIDELTHFLLQKCKFKCTKTDTKHEKALIKRTSQHNIRLWERQYTVSLFSISTSLTLNSRSTVAKKLPKLSFPFAPSKSSPRCERRCFNTHVNSEIFTVITHGVNSKQLTALKDWCEVGHAC